jgi:hypothetical protein
MVVKATTTVTTGLAVETFGGNPMAHPEQSYAQQYGEEAPK